MDSNSMLVSAVVIFVVSYAFILSEKIHRSLAALAGGLLMLLLGIINFAKAKEALDLNTIGLLIGMMIIVGITRRSGVFEYLAVKAAKWAQGRPIRILVAMAVITAVLSAFLDNVTTVLLLVPVTFSIVDTLELNPMPFLVAEILASNIGGTATLIGDPPNIMIGGAVPHLSFMDFMINLAPINIIVLIVTLSILYLIYRKEFTYSPEKAAKLIQMDPLTEIKDFALMKKSLFVLALTVAGFIFHQTFHWDSSVVALSGAILLMIIAKEEPEDVFLAIEWPTIFFFAGLFILVGGLEKVGVIRSVAEEAMKLTGGEMVKTSMLVLWLSAVASAVVDNIPFVATMIPLIKNIGQLGGIANLDPLWWSLALGACLGGNGTLIGASANVIVAGIAEKNGVPITFWGFTKIAFPLMLLSIAICSAYVYLVYLV